MTSQDPTADSSNGPSVSLETAKARRAAQLAAARLAKKARAGGRAASKKSQPSTGVPSGLALSVEPPHHAARTTSQEISPAETSQAAKAVAQAAVAVTVTEASSRMNDRRPSAPDVARVMDHNKQPAPCQQGGSVSSTAPGRRKATPPKAATLTPPSQAIAKPTNAPPIPSEVVAPAQSTPTPQPPTVAAPATTTRVTPSKPQSVAVSISAVSSSAVAPPRPVAQRSVVTLPLPPAASAPAGQASSSIASSTTNGSSTSSLAQVAAARRTTPPISAPGGVPSASPTIRPALGELDWQDRSAKQPADASAAAATQQQNVISAFRAATLAAEQAVASRRRSLSSSDASAAAPICQRLGTQSTTTIEQSATTQSSGSGGASEESGQASQSTSVATSFAGNTQAAPISTQRGHGQTHQSTSGTPPSPHHNAPQQPPSTPAATTGVAVATVSPVATVSRSNPSLVIFNKDGTLFDFQTTWIGWIESQAWRLEAAVGKPIRELFFDAMGYNWQSRTVQKDSVLSTYPKHELGTKVVTEFLIGQGVPHVDAARLIKEHWSLPKEASTYRPREDLAALFRTITALGIKIAIVTSDQREVTEKILNHLGVERLVDLVSCGDDGLPTNRPERIWAICSRLGVSTSNTILVGDTADDMVLGRSAGCVLSIGVLGGAGSLADLAADADFLVPSVNNVIKVLFQYRLGFWLKREAMY